MITVENNAKLLENYKILLYPPFSTAHKISVDFGGSKYSNHS